MKKGISVVLALVLSLMLVACGNKEAAAPSTIKIGTSPDYPPYEAYDASGAIVGFDIDAVNRIIELMNEDGGGTTEAEWIAMDFSTIISAVQTGQVDIGVSCFTYDPDREGQVLFTDYYLKSAQVAAVAASSEISTLTDLEGKQIGAGAGTTGESAAREIAGTTVTSMGDYVQMFEILKNGGLDAVVCDEAVALNYAATGDYKIIEEKLIDEEVMIIASTDNQALVDRLNTAIAAFMESDEYDTLKEKWGL